MFDTRELFQYDSRRIYRSNGARKTMLTEWARHQFKWLLDPIAEGLAKLGISPNFLTFFGVLLNAGAAYLLATGQFLVGGLAVGFASAFDALDGALARQTGRTTAFGAFLDSTLDRYSEAILYFGLSFHYIYAGEGIHALLCYAAITGSLLVSYARARAEGLGLECKEGLLTRVERTLLLILFLLINRMDIGLWVIALLAHVTAAQRIYTVWRKTDNGRRPLS